MRPIRIITIARALLDSRKGATAVEYGLILSLMVLVMLVGFQKFATQALAIWNMVATKVVTVSN